MYLSSFPRPALFAGTEGEVDKITACKDTARSEYPSKPVITIDRYFIIVYLVNNS